MNSWLKLALYSFIGIIIGSFILGILGSPNGVGNTMIPMGNMNGGYYGHQGMNDMQERMQYGMGTGMSMRGGMGMQNGMGMHGGM